VGRRFRNYVLTWDDGSGKPQWESGGTDIVLDTTPQLGGSLDTNGHNINHRGSSLRNGIALYDDGTIDPDVTVDEIILTTHVNCPTEVNSSDYYYVRTTFYAGDTASKTTSNNRVQEAIAYGLVAAQKNRFYVRTYISSTWSSWVEK